MRVFYFGMGYSSRAVARALHNFGSSDISGAGTVRDTTEIVHDRAHALHKFHGNAPGETLRGDLGEATHLILSIPPDDHGDPVLRHHAGDITAAKRLQWLCYFSTVGVYGDFGGATIDETAETRPINPRSQRRVEVERQWQAFAKQRDLPLLILRLAGIYGPGRSQFDKLRDGTARRIIKPGQVFNRIHVDDIGRITALAAQQNLAGAFNLADDEAASPQEVVAYAAGLLGLAPPPEQAFDTAEMTPMARSFYADNKRVSNAAIKRALGIDLLYPTYREGLKAILETEKQPP